MKNLFVTATLLSLLILPSASAMARTSHDFTATLPAGASATNVAIKDGKLQLASDESGAYVREGYVDIPVVAADVSGLTLRFSATRANALVNGDFSDTSLNKVYIYNPATSGCRALESLVHDQTAGLWFSSAPCNFRLPLIFNATTDASANYAAKLNRTTNPLMQFVKITPGTDQDFTLRFDLDALNLAETSTGTKQKFSVAVGFLNADFQILNIYNPKNDKPLCKTFPCSYPYFPLATYDNDESGAKELNFSVIDCEGTAGDETTLDLCLSGGASLEVLDDDHNVVGSYDSSDDVAYMALAFKASWIGTSAETVYNANYAAVDDIDLDLTDQITVEILNADGAVLESTTNEQDYVVTTTDAATVRLRLKSLSANASPAVTALSFDVSDDTDTDGDGIPDINDDDRDGDGHAHTPAGEDCDDTNPNVSPNASESCATSYDDNCDGALTSTATEVCGDGIDQDCDGSDETCPIEPDDDAVAADDAIADNSDTPTASNATADTDNADSSDNAATNDTSADTQYASVSDDSAATTDSGNTPTATENATDSEDSVVSDNADGEATSAATVNAANSEDNADTTSTDSSVPAPDSDTEDASDNVATDVASANTQYASVSDDAGAIADSDVTPDADSDQESISDNPDIAPTDSNADTDEADDDTQYANDSNEAGDGEAETSSTSSSGSCALSGQAHADGCSTTAALILLFVIWTGWLRKRAANITLKS